jgi:hypothetical protein
LLLLFCALFQQRRGLLSTTIGTRFPRSAGPMHRQTSRAKGTLPPGAQLRSSAIERGATFAIRISSCPRANIVHFLINAWATRRASRNKATGLQDTSRLDTQSPRQELGDVQRLAAAALLDLLSAAEPVGENDVIVGSLPDFRQQHPFGGGHRDLVLGNRSPTRRQARPQKGPSMTINNRPAR